MIIKKIKAYGTYIGRLLIIACAIVERPILLYVFLKEREIEDGKVACSQCNGKNIEITIVPGRFQTSAPSSLLPGQFQGITWLPATLPEELRLTCRACGATV